MNFVGALLFFPPFLPAPVPPSLLLCGIMPASTQSYQAVLCRINVGCVAILIQVITLTEEEKIIVEKAFLSVMKSWYKHWNSPNISPGPINLFGPFSL